MQLVGSPNKGCNVFGQQLNPQESKFYTETIFKHLTSSQNLFSCLMTTNSLGRMDFLAHKICEKVEVKIPNKYTKNQIIFAAKTLMILFRMRTTDSLLILLHWSLTIVTSMWQKNRINPKIGSFILPDTYSNFMHKKYQILGLQIANQIHSAKDWRPF